MIETRLHTQSKADAPVSFALPRSGILQRKCACGGTRGASGECEGCRKKKSQGKTKVSALESQNDSSVPSIVHEVLRSSGEPLDASTRAFMEPRFGHDFSRVRVHTDGQAAESAGAMNALAYTVGRDVVFGRGQYAPDSRAGSKLLAHELTHVVQQRFADSASPFQAGSNNNDHDHEIEATKTADNFLADPSQVRVPTITTEKILARDAEDEPIKIDRSFELDPNMFVKSMDAPAEREQEAGPFSCPAGFKDIGSFRLTAYVLAQEGEFLDKPKDENPCGLKGTFSHAFLFQTDKSPRGVKTQGSGMSLGNEIIHYKGNNCFEVLDCAKTKSGTCAQSRRTVAVDTSVIPLGSELIIEGLGRRVAEDTGGQINGAHIDIFYGTEISTAEALRKTVTGKKVCRKLIKGTPKKTK
jgi:3D (Asp-Asp-Asp) domain-containing protein